jgi:ElaA protein
MQITWTFKAFPMLTLDELYALLQLRSKVFVVEQNCPFLDIDDKDQLCYHLLGAVATQPHLAAYTRIVPAGVAFDHVSIGRVVTAPEHRRFGMGRQLMARSIEEVERLYGKVPIQIGAQLYLRAFYTSFGFEPCSDLYLEDGIEHIDMIRHCK